MTVIKRWAFVPLLALICLIATGWLLPSGAPRWLGLAVGLVLVLAAAAWIDHRRKHPVANRRRLTFWT